MTRRGRDREREPTTADLAARARSREHEEGADTWTEGPEEAPLDTDLSREVPAAAVAPTAEDAPGRRVGRTPDEDVGSPGRDRQPGSDPSDRVALLETGETGTLREAWEEIQTGFVDDPRRSVEEADRLVARLMSRLAETFAEERSRLQDRWERGEEVTTEDLRVALRRYRSFFDRLLAF